MLYLCVCFTQSLINKLGISELAYRSNDSEDVVPYTHQKIVTVVGVTLAKDLTTCQLPLLKLFREQVLALQEHKVRASLQTHVQVAHVHV